MRSRNSNLPRYVYRQIIKGHVYYRFRRSGGGSVRLPDDPGTPEFHRAYARLVEAPKADDRYRPESVAYAIDAYYRSADFAQLATGTQRDYRRYLNRLDNSVGERDLPSIDAPYIFQLRDKLRATPSAANHAVAVIRSLFRFAVTRGLAKTDPTTGVPKLRGGDGYLRWSEADIELFRRSASPTMRLAMEIGLYTGQRLSDVIRMGWSNYDGARIRLRQQKTGTTMVIPVHPDLKATLDGMARANLTILTTKTGRSFHPRVFSRDFRNARKGAGLPDGLSFHGLRHTAASVLAELGAGAPEIQAITGHKSLKLVEHYISQARQEVRADRAIARLPERRK